MNKHMIAAHFTPLEIKSLIQLQGGASRDKKTGLLEFSKLEHLGTDPTFKEVLRKITEVMKTDHSLATDVKKEISPLKEPTYGNKLVRNIANKGREGDKELALIPKSLAEVFVEVWCHGKPNINPKTGLLEFTAFRMIQGPAKYSKPSNDYTGLALGAMSLLGEIFGPKHKGDRNDPYGYVEAAKIQAESAERLAARARADKEDLMKKMGYYDAVHVDHRPWRHRLNPHYNTRTAKAGIPMYLGKEYVDPKTGKALSNPDAWIKLEERVKEQGLDPSKLPMNYEYVPDPDDQDKVARYYSEPLIKALDTADVHANFGFKGHRSLQDKQLEKISGKNKNLLSNSDEPYSNKGGNRSLKNLVASLAPKNVKRPKSLSVQSERPKTVLELKALSRHDNSDANYKTGGLVSHKVSCGIKGKGTGQSDDIKVDMPVGSYIIDATTTAHLGDGSSTAGIKALDNMVKSISKSPVRKLIEKRIQVKKIPVAVANEEYKIDPVTVSVIGNGDLGKGSKLLERMVKRVRQHKAQGGLNLPPQALSPLEYLKV